MIISVYFDWVRFYLAEEMLKKAAKTFHNKLWLDAVDRNLVKHNVITLQVYILADLVFIVDQGSDKQHCQFAESLL